MVALIRAMGCHLTFGRGRRRWRPASPHGDIDAALTELRQFNDHELADIGLSRGCLSPEGLQNCGDRRARHSHLR